VHIFAFLHIFLHQKDIDGTCPFRRPEMAIVQCETSSYFSSVKMHPNTPCWCKSQQKKFGKVVPFVYPLYLSTHYWQCFQ